MPNKKGAPSDEEERRRRRMKPSPIQEKIRQAVRCYRREHGYPPSRAELSRELEVTEANIHYHLTQMVLKGWANVDPHVQRSIVLLREGVPLIDAATGEGLDETDPDRPRLDGLEAVFGKTPDLFVRIGNDTMARAGVRKGDLVAVACNREPEHDDLVAARINDAVELRRFRKTDRGDMLEAEPDEWTVTVGPRMRADAENVTMLGVEIGCIAPAGGRKTRKKEKVRGRSMGF